MLKTLQSGISGLRNHQMKIDVIGNNIANVNTIGFKGGRIMFTEALNQTLQKASAGAGSSFIDPMKVGLGVNTSSIETIFTQGGLENTGNITDLALEGEGFFLVNNGDSNLYTRSGNFFFNQEGKLVNQNGMAVQGWILNGQATVGGQGIGNTEDVIVDRGFVSPAQATENIYLNENINAGNRTVAGVWQSQSFVNHAIVAGSGAAPAFPMTITAAVNDELTINIQDNATSRIYGDLTLTGGVYTDLDALVDELNIQIGASPNISTRVEAVNNSGTLEFHQLNGVVDTVMTINDGTTSTALATIGFADGDTDTASTAIGTTDLNNLLDVNTFDESLISGDTIDIYGTNPDGSAVTATFTYGAANDGTTLGELAAVIESNFSDVTVTISAGSLVITDDVAGNSQTTLTLSNGVANPAARSIAISGFENTTVGNTGTAVTSVLVYDSLGASHNLVLTFTNTEEANEWTWAASTTGDGSIASGGSGRVSFNEHGEMSSFSYDGGATSLTLNTGNGADQVELVIHAESTDDYSGISQFDSVSTLNVRDQDGKSTGTMLGISIDRDGIISGSFSNGDITSMAKIGIARFPNRSGLSDLGDGLYATSTGSGDPQILNPDSDVSSSIVSGALETSNVDLADQFTELITAQRGFQANAKIITTADSILDEVIRLKR